jgi:hypothetical protein
MLSPGDIVIEDNLSSPQFVGVREATEAVGPIFRPLPHRPDFDSIEQVFAKLALLRKTGEQTVEALWQTFAVRC